MARARTYKNSTRTTVTSKKPGKLKPIAKTSQGQGLTKVQKVQFRTVAQSAKHVVVESNAEARQRIEDDAIEDQEDAEVVDDNQLEDQEREDDKVAGGSKSGSASEDGARKQDDDTGVPYRIQYHAPVSGKKRKHSEMLEPPKTSTSKDGPQDQVFKVNRRLDVRYKVVPVKDQKGTRAPAWLSLRSYEAFNTSDLKIRIGDIVYVCASEPGKSDEDDWVAQILETRALDSEHVYLRVSWFLRPADLPDGRQSHHAYEEVFPSNQMDVIDAMTVDGKVDAVDEVDETSLLDVCGGCDNLCYRQTYDCREKGLMGKLAQICKCKGHINPDKGVLQCPNEYCAEWMHPQCIEADVLRSVYDRNQPAIGTKDERSDAVSTPAKAKSPRSPARARDVTSPPKDESITITHSASLASRFTRGLKKFVSLSPAPSSPTRPRTADGTGSPASPLKKKKKGEEDLPTILEVEEASATLPPRKSALQSPSRNKTAHSTSPQKQGLKEYTAKLEMQAPDPLYTSPLLVTIRQTSNQPPTKPTTKPQPKPQCRSQKSTGEEQEPPAESVFMEPAKCLFCQTGLLVPKGHSKLDPAMVSEEEDTSKEGDEHVENEYDES